jgi:tetratricopeptide (TPR) repeat protein
MRAPSLLVALLVALPACRGMLPKTGKALDHLVPDSAESKRLYTLYAGNGQRYFDGGKYAQAEDQFLRALEQDTYSHKANLGAGWSALQQGTPAKLETAIERFNRTIDLDDSDSRAWLGLGVAHAELGLRQLRESEAADEKHPTAKEPERSQLASDAKRLRGESTRNFAEGREALEKTLQLHRDDPRALLALGNIAANQNDFATAERHYRKYVDLARQTREIFQKRKPTLETEDDRKAMVDKINRNVKDEGRARDMLAAIYFKQERHQDALAELNTILDIDVQPPDNVYLLRAQCLASSGKYEDAVQDVDRFLKYTARKFDPLVEEAYKLKDEYSRKLASAAGARK